MTIVKDISIDFLGVKCENPFFLSSSPVGGNYEMVAKCFEMGWAGVYFKTIGFFIADECSPRFDAIGKESTPWVGFKNMEQISDKPLDINLQAMARLKKDYPDKVIVASIMGQNEQEWEDLARLVTEAGVDMIECNFSCPQMTSHAMGSDVGTDAGLVRRYSAATVRGTHLPVIAKMTPNITVMEVPALAAVEGGAHGLSAINTIKSITRINLDALSAMPVVNGKSSVSGYSGAAVKPIALRFCAQLKQNEVLKNVPLSGMGGIETWRDAVEFLLLGCENLQVTTAIMQYGYRIIDDLRNGLMHYMDEQGYDRITDFIGLALNNLVPAEEINRDFKVIPHINDDKCIGCGRCYVSCFDAAHQAIDWCTDSRKPSINDECVGCHLCINVCPVVGCITPGEIKFKAGRSPRKIAEV